MSLEDLAGLAHSDQVKAKVDSASADAKAYAEFYKELRQAGMTEDQAFTLTHEWMILLLSPADEVKEDED